MDRIYVVSPRCPHLGCQLSGTRTKRAGTAPVTVPALTTKGTLINNPALTDLPSWTS